MNSKFLLIYVFFSFPVSTICFVYINHMTFFTACLAIHEQRIDQNRHFCTCCEIEPRSSLTTDRSYCFLCCCSGDRSKAGENTSSTMESLSRKLLAYCVLRSWFKILVLALCLIFIGFSMWKTSSFTIGDYKTELLTRNSYYRKFADINEHLFTSDFYVTFNIPRFILDKAGQNATKEIAILKSKLTAYDNINIESFISWSESYDSFLNSQDAHSNVSFDNQISTFLTSYPQFKNDFAFDNEGTIISTRVYAKIRKVRNLEDTRMLKRSLVKDDYVSESTSELENRITLYAPMFVFVDKHTRPLIESLTQIGVLITTNIILTTLVCPAIRVVAIQLILFVTTVTGSFGLMEIFNLEITAFSMIIVVFGMCYIASINAHMIYSFYTTAGIDRQSRTHTVLTTTSVSYFNTIIASVFGLLALLLIKSYIFATVMHVLVINLVLSFIQAVMIYPVCLSLFGPNSC